MDAPPVAVPLGQRRMPARQSLLGRTAGWMSKRLSNNNQQPSARERAGRIACGDSARVAAGPPRVETARFTARSSEEHRAHLLAERLSAQLQSLREHLARIGARDVTQLILAVRR